MKADEHQQRGEFVLVVRGADDAAGDDGDGEARRVLSVLMEELPLKQAAALSARLTGGKKNELYQMALRMRQDLNP